MKRYGGESLVSDHRGSTRVSVSLVLPCSCVCSTRCFVCSYAEHACHSASGKCLCTRTELPPSPLVVRAVADLAAFVARSWRSTCRWLPTRRSRARHPVTLALPYDPRARFGRSLCRLVVRSQVQGGRPGGGGQLRCGRGGLHDARLPRLRHRDVGAVRSVGWYV